MSSKSSESRRIFIQNCVSTSVACAGMASPPAARTASAVELKVKRYLRTKLIDPRGNPIKSSSLEQGKNYLFHYPFQATPVFLLRLSSPINGKRQLSNGVDSYETLPGIGADSSLIAFSAICAHKLAYPTPQISFISFSSKLKTKDGSVKTDIIHCCADHSQYDAKAGALVMSGPAPHPLTSIALEHDTARDEIYAIGTLGPEVYDAFFSKYAFKLQLDLGVNATAATRNTAVVHAMDKFCKQTTDCIAP